MPLSISFNIMVKFYLIKFIKMANLFLNFNLFNLKWNAKYKYVEIHLPRSLTIFPFLWVVAIDIQNSSTSKRAIVWI